MALTLTRGMTQGFRTAWFSVLGTAMLGIAGWLLLNRDSAR